MAALFGTADVPKDQRVEDWYDDAVSQALFDYGHAGYSGSISETSGVTEVDRHFATLFDAEEWLAENAQKWEDALVVTYGEDKQRLCGFWAAF